MNFNRALSLALAAVFATTRPPRSTAPTINRSSVPRPLGAGLSASMMPLTTGCGSSKLALSKGGVVQRILVIRGGAIGDLILTLPAIGALRSVFPNARIDVIGDTRWLNLARHPMYADAVIDTERWDIYRLFSHEPRVPKQLAAYLSAFDLILSYLPTSDTTFTNSLKRYCPGEVMGWSPHPSGVTHVTDHLMEPVLRYAIQGLPAEPRVFPHTEDRRAANQLWRSAGLPERGVLAVHPGSGGRHKLWPLEGWQQVLAWAAKEGVPGVLIYGPAEEERGLGPLLNHLNPAWKVLRGAPLPQLAAILAKCEVFAGHDSGITHLAAAVGTCTLALFGPTDPLMWGPRSRRTCVTQPAPPGPLGLHNLPADIVIRTLQALLDGTFQFNPSDLGHTRLQVPA